MKGSSKHRGVRCLPSKTGLYQLDTNREIFATCCQTEKFSEKSAKFSRKVCEKFFLTVTLIFIFLMIFDSPKELASAKVNALYNVSLRSGILSYIMLLLV